MPNFYNLNLLNWRCFKSSKFQVPKNNLIILDNNGSGKTSYLSAVYLLLTGNFWPGTKVLESVSFDYDYALLATENPDNYIAIKRNKTGKYSLQKSLLNSNILSFSYRPDDNFWLFRQRAERLEFLDYLLVEIWGKDYKQLLNNQNKILANKQGLIRSYKGNNWSSQRFDLYKIYTEQLLRTGSEIWNFRKQFLDNLNLSMTLFCNYLNNNEQIYLTYKNTLFKNQKENQKGYYSIDTMKEVIQNDLLKNREFINQLIYQELNTGRVLYGPQKDDLDFVSNISISKKFSRGEMRLFILFVKTRAIKFAKSIYPEKLIYWFMDDVLNEFDDHKTRTVFLEFLPFVDWYLITTAHQSEFLDSTFVTKLNDLKID